MSRDLRSIPDTPTEELRRDMLNSVVTGFSIEFLRTRNPVTRQFPMYVAEPVAHQRLEQKNHVTLRLTIRDSFPYRDKGQRKECNSVRASIEPDDEEQSYDCTSIKLKPMANSDEASNSAAAAFFFQFRPECRVRDFVAVARNVPGRCLLPFEYTEVSGTIVRYSGRRPDDVAKHSNGCRDFTAQWFTLLYQQNFVEWQAYGASFPDPPGLEFDTIMAWRYSKELGEPVMPTHSYITRAKFYDQSVRQETVMVGNNLKVLPYEETPREGRPVYDPRDYKGPIDRNYRSDPKDYAWDYQPSAASSAGGGSSSNQNFSAYSSRYGGAGSSSSQYTTAYNSSSGTAGSNYNQYANAYSSPSGSSSNQYATSGYANDPYYGKAGSSSNQYATSGYDATDPYYETSGSSSNQASSTGYSRRFDKVRFSKR